MHMHDFSVRTAAVRLQTSGLTGPAPDTKHVPIQHTRTMSISFVTGLRTVTRNVQSRVEAALDETGGVLRPAPHWVPRSFFPTGLRLKLDPDYTHDYGGNRG